MESKLVFYFLVVFGVICCSASQLLLKQSADKEHRNKIAYILNWRVILAYGVFFLSIIINITSLQHGVNLKDIPILEATGYIFVPILSLLFLKEKLNKQTILATAIILLGIIVFYI